MISEAKNFCACHDGVDETIYLEEHLMLRVRCNDGSKKMLVLGQKIKRCK